ncbi:MAG TPA: thioredoxin domain-containing protein [Gemmatimonadaceae bacterium]|nr:thioredoxin domain-containing protein [Gemmatimonadaceae bacterium]
MQSQNASKFVNLGAALARSRGSALVVVLAASVIASGCSDQKANAAPAVSAPPPSASSEIPNVLATIGNEQVTLADVRARVGDNLDQMEARFRQSQYTLINNTLTEILRDRVLMEEAKKQGKTVDQLVAAELGGPLEPTDLDISSWYSANINRVRGRTLEQVRPQIAELLRNERRKEAMEKLQQRLNEERRVTVLLEPYRVPLDNEGAPSLGPDNAPVTLVEFSDFDCPFCGRFHPTLKQLSEKFGNQLRVVYRQYPIPSLHPNAFKAAEASLCAHDQKKFWEMHDTMFQEQGRLSVSELKEKAGRLGLDRKKFDSCLDTGKYTERVQNDIKDGGRAGVTGTPALFVNGVEVEGGAVGFDVVAKAIEAELARAKR